MMEAVETHIGDDEPVAQWCARHWAPYAASLGNGIQACLLLVEQAFSDERFARLIGYDPATGARASTSAERINVALAQVSPICCFLGDEAMAGIFEQCKRRSDA